MTSSTETNNFDTNSQDTSFIEVITLHPKELQLIKSLRNNWRFGDVVIRMRDGLPFRLIRITEFIDLNEK